MNFLDWVDVRCPDCNKLLFKIYGLAVVETVCPRCGAKSEYPTLSPRITNKFSEIFVSATVETIFEEPP